MVLLHPEKTETLKHGAGRSWTCSFLTENNTHRSLRESQSAAWCIQEHLWHLQNGAGVSVSTVVHYLWRDTEKFLQNFRSRIACGQCHGEEIEGWWERCPTVGLVEVRAYESKELMFKWDKKLVGKHGNTSVKESLKPHRGQLQVSEVCLGAQEGVCRAQLYSSHRQWGGRTSARHKFSNYPVSGHSSSCWLSVFRRSQALKHFLKTVC